MRFCCLASGSEGNSTLVESISNGIAQRILIDCGLSLSLLKEKLFSRGLSPRDINGVFVTHEHQDHCKGIVPLVKSVEVPVFMTYGTFLANREIRKNLSPVFLSPFKGIKFKGLEVNPIPVPHDARESVALKVEDSSFKLGVLTDVGTITKNIRDALDDVDALILEFNYDDSLLSQSKYPEALKRRISSRQGHLSNSSALKFAETFLQRKRKALVAAHLSSKNNSHNVVTNLLNKLCCEKEIVLLIADQNDGTPWINLD